MQSHRCSTCPLVLGCWELSHVIFLKLSKKELLAKLSKFIKWQHFSLKTTTYRDILSENSCHFMNLLDFASSSFILSLRKITWLNSQQPKSRGHVEHHNPEQKSWISRQYRKQLTSNISKISRISQELKFCAPMSYCNSKA